jgi:hypothetical protein
MNTTYSVNHEIVYELHRISVAFMTMGSHPVLFCVTAISGHP